MSEAKPVKKTSDRTEEIGRFILENVSDHPEDIARVTAEHFHISRQAVHRHLKRLVDNGQLTAAGTTRSRTYAIAPLASTGFSLNISSALQEDEVWRQCVEPLLGELQPNGKAICFYGLTEMLSNVIDYSGSVTYGDENLISRSQAKRLLARFEKFREVILDFSGVETIGQAFADEVFRVFKSQHPEVTLVPINASPEAMKMIRRAEALGKTGG